MIQLQAIEAADTELEWQDSGREKVLEQNFRSILRVHLDDVEKYGLEQCLYFQTLRIFCKVYFFTSLLAIFQLFFALEGTRFVEDDLCSRLATLTLGNVDESTEVSAGTLRFRLSSGDSFLSFGLCLALQLFFPALALALLVLHFWRHLAGHPDLTSEPSVADYAVEIFGLPSDASEAEILSHFEALLKDAPDSDASSGLVCDVQLTRDFRGALLCALELQVLESQGEATSREAVARQVLRLKRHQLEENQRPVWSGFVVLSNELERDWLMQRYRWSSAIPLLRHLQWKSLRYGGKWPLYLRAAPEPIDVLWAHYLDGRYFGRASVIYQVMLRACSVLLLGLLLASGTGISWLIWWQLLGSQAVFPMQCTMWSPLADSCGCPAAETCESWRAALAVVVNWWLSELVQVLGSWLVLWHSKWWRSSLRARHENGRMILLVLAQGASVFCPLVGLWLLKLSWGYGILAAPVDMADAKWQGDLALYLYVIPVVELWCLTRWLVVTFFAVRSCILGKTSQRFVLWRQYASLVFVLGTTLIFQTLAPLLVPLAAVGLLCRYWLEKFSMVNGAMTVRCGTPVRLALQAANTAATCLWIAIIMGCGLTAYMLWTGEWSMSSPAAYVALLALLLVGFPLLEGLFGRFFWLSCGVGSPPNTWRPAVRTTATRWNQAAPPRMSYHEAWLIMRHKNILSSYNYSDHPDFHRSNVLQRLQPHGAISQDAPRDTARMGRSIDMTCSRAVVLEKAPSRAPTQGK